MTTRRDFLFGTLAAAVSKALPAPKRAWEVLINNERFQLRTVNDVDPEVELTLNVIRRAKEALEGQGFKGDIGDILVAIHRDTYQRALRLGALRESALIELDEVTAVIKPTNEFLSTPWHVLFDEGEPHMTEEYPGPTSEGLAALAAQSAALAELPRYRCHKEVWALKIKQIIPTPDGGAQIESEEGFAPFHVSADYVRKHQPEAGGYWVQYADGYQSWSPAEAFESGYTRIDDGELQEGAGQPQLAERKQEEPTPTIGR